MSSAATAKAAVLEQFSQPLVLREFPLPAQLEPEAALVKVLMAGVCGTDPHLWKGQLPVPLPLILGHETVGEIVELGVECHQDWLGNRLQRGDRVTWSSAILCGSCFYCKVKRQPTRCLHRKAYGISYRCDESPHLLGGYAEYVYLRPGTSLFRLPADLRTEAVIGAGCALVTVIHGLERIGLHWGDRVVIQGAGPLGLSALALAKHAGAAQTILIGGPKHRLELAKQFGADTCIDISEVANSKSRIERVRELTGGYGGDLVVECVGLPRAVPEGIEMCRDGGRYLVLGHYADAGSVELNPHVITRKQLTVAGSWASEPRHMATALEFLKRHQDRFPFDRLVSHCFSLAEAFQALQAMGQWAVCKSVIVP